MKSKRQREAYAFWREKKYERPDGPDMYTRTVDLKGDGCAVFVYRILKDSVMHSYDLNVYNE